MNIKRKEARDKLSHIRTKNELLEYLDALAISEEDKQIAYEMYALGYSHAQIAIKHSMSIETSKKTIQRILDKVL